MRRTLSRAGSADSVRWYQSPDIPMSAIRRYIRQVAEHFQPEQIILFGSYARGNPHQDSDVDILVVMPARNEIDQSVRILRTFDPPFSTDLIVRTPQHLARGLADEDWFLREIVETGKVLYEKTDGAVAAQGRSRSQKRKKKRSPTSTA
jgi:predicted nucleotidyltransferase